MPYPKPWPCDCQPWDTPQGLALLGTLSICRAKESRQNEGEATVGQLGKEIRIQSQIGIFLPSWIKWSHMGQCSLHKQAEINCLTRWLILVSKFLLKVNLASVTTSLPLPCFTLLFVTRPGIFFFHVHYGKVIPTRGLKILCSGKDPWCHFQLCMASFKNYPTELWSWEQLLANLAFSLTTSSRELMLLGPPATREVINTAGRNKKNKLVWKSSTPNRILPTWKPICQAGILLATQAVYYFHVT